MKVFARMEELNHEQVFDIAEKENISTHAASNHLAEKRLQDVAAVRRIHTQRTVIHRDRRRNAN